MPTNDPVPPKLPASASQAEALPISQTSFSLKRAVAISFGAIFFEAGLKVNQILEKLTGIPAGQCQPENIDLDPEKVKSHIRENGVSATLLYNLGIRASRRKTKEPVTVDELKKLIALFTLIDPIDANIGYRVTVVRNDRRALARAGFTKPQLPGTLLFRIMDSASGPALHVHQNIYSAARKTAHQARGHDRELKKIVPFVERVDQLVDALTLWRIAETGERRKLRNDSLRLGKTLERVLRFARNKKKFHAYELGLAAAGLKDSRDRFNILASSTRYYVLAKNLLERIGQITGIDKYNREDQIALTAAMLEQEAVLRHIHQRTQATSGFVGKLAQKKSFNMDGYLMSVGLSDDALQRLVTRPFCAFRDSFLDSRAVFSLNAGRYKGPEAGAAIAGMAYTAQLGLVEMTLQWAKFYLVANKKGVPAARKQFSKAQQLLAEMKLQAPYSDLPDAIRKLDAACRAYGEAKKEGLAKAKRDLKAAFENASVEARFLAGSVN